MEQYLITEIIRWLVHLTRFVITFVLMTGDFDQTTEQRNRLDQLYNYLNRHDN